MFVDRNDGSDLTGGPRDERLVSGEDISRRVVDFADYEIHLARQVDDERARDAGQQAGRQRCGSDLAVLDDKKFD